MINFRIDIAMFRKWSELRMLVTESPRLTLRWLDVSDAPFILELVNQPSWLEHIGDKGVHNLSQAIAYIENGPRKMYFQYGFGLLMMEERQRGEPVGICGLIKRETLDDVDLGFALLSRFEGQGYAFEGARAVLDWAALNLGPNRAISSADANMSLVLERIVAITSFSNSRSIRLLERLGFVQQGTRRLSEAGEELNFYVLNLQQP